jgi:hypothetical protein
MALTVRHACWRAISDEQSVTGIMSIGGTLWRIQNSTRLNPFGKTNASETLLVQFQTFFKYKPVSLFRISHFIRSPSPRKLARTLALPSSPFTVPDSAPKASFKTVARRMRELKAARMPVVKISVIFLRTSRRRHNLRKKSRAVAPVAWLNSSSVHFFISATAWEISFT